MGKCLNKQTKRQKFEDNSDEINEILRNETEPDKLITSPLPGREISFGTQTISQKQKGSIKWNYQIQTVLGQGAYGIVKKAVHNQTQQVRAIKTIKKFKGMTQSQIQEIIDEFEILRNLDHPNIVKVYEFYEEPLEFHIVTEFCSGGDLFDRISRQKKFGEVNAARKINQILLALVYLHSQNITHRDLKPENLLIADEKEEKLHIKVADFGTAKFSDPNQTMDQIQGSPYYVAPEVIKKQYNNKCDIWSTGIILYILLGGKPPFDGKNNKEIFNAVLSQQLQFPTEKWGKISNEGKDLVTKMLNKDPNQRPTAEECLQHPWIQNSVSQNISSPLILESLKNLKNFSQQQKLSQAVSTFVAFQMATQEEKQELEDLFKQLDKNNDGKLCRQEILKGFSDRFPTQQEAEAFVNDIMEKCDNDGSGFIEFTEFITACIDKKKLLSNERIGNVFNAFDADGSEKISYKELKKILGGNVSQKAWEQICEGVDVNGDGEIDLKEFQEMLQAAFK